SDCSGAEEGAHRRHYVLLLLLAQLGEDRQREDLARRLLGMREVALTIAEVSEALLQMERDGIVDGAPHAPLAQEGAQLIAPAVEHTDRVLVDDRLVLRPHGGGADAVQVTKGLVVEARVAAATLAPLLQVRQLDR